MIFPTDLKLLKKLDGLDEIDVSKLPQLYRADMEFSRSFNNDAINIILRSLPEHPEYKYVSIDSRSHMLMKGMYPCIPGWHCDDFYRVTKEHQPSIDSVLTEAPAQHYIIVLGENSRTEFLAGDIDLPSPKELIEKYGEDKPYYLSYDEIIDEMAPPTVLLESKHLYSFGPLCFHKGQAATENGWRYFMRITFSNHREPKNEVRYQTQVYSIGRVSW